MKLWIARDKTGELWVFKEKPLLDIYYWYDPSSREGSMAELDKNLFPEVTFENSPQQVELNIIK